MTEKPAGMTEKPAALSWSAVTARRMVRHALAEPAADIAPAGVASLLCGAHAQVLSAAELSIGRRLAATTGPTSSATCGPSAPWSRRSAPRGTVDLLPTAELPMWTGALSALPQAPGQPEGVRFTPGQAEEVIAAIGAALAGDELTVDELTEAIART